MYQKRNNEWRILALYLGDYSNQFYLREISYLAKLPVKTTQNLLLSLKKQKVLQSFVRGKNKYFRLNLNNIQIKFLLLQSEIFKTILLLDKYPVFKTFLKEIKTNEPLIIFGGFARFRANKDSDLDLLIIAKVEPKLPLNLIPYDTHKIKLSKSSFLKAVNQEEPLIKEIEREHVILNNHSFYINTMWSYYEKS